MVSVSFLDSITVFGLLSLSVIVSDFDLLSLSAVICVFGLVSVSVTIGVLGFVSASLVAAPFGVAPSSVTVFVSGTTSGFFSLVFSSVSISLSSSFSRVMYSSTIGICSGTAVSTGFGKSVGLTGFSAIGSTADGFCSEAVLLSGFDAVSAGCVFCSAVSAV